MRIGRSVPFVAFHVERVLERADVGTAEGKDRALAELRRCSGRCAPSVLRDELVRRVAGRLDLSDQLAASLIGEAGPPAAATAPATSDPSGSRPHANGTPAPPPPPVLAGLDRRERGERTFLALCVTFPREGRALLEEGDLDRQFSSDLARRAAVHLRVHLEAPLDGLPDDDPELATFVSDLDARAARGGSGVRPGNLEHAWLSLELARLERAIDLARASGTADGSVSRLSAEREQVRTRLRVLSGQLQSA